MRAVSLTVYHIPDHLLVPDNLLGPVTFAATVRFACSLILWFACSFIYVYIFASCVSAMVVIVILILRDPSLACWIQHEDDGTYKANPAYGTPFHNHNRDHEDKWNATKCCKYCKELKGRHGPHMLQKDLERVMTKACSYL
jgi:hypothetical protein